jgi:hypothetical protein
MSNNKMSVTKKIEFILKSLEMGADVSLNFHNCRYKEDALNIAATLSEFSNLPIEFNKDDDSDLRWITISERGLDTGIFYREKAEVTG